MSKYTNQEKKEKIKAEKGSVTLFVLIAMIFFLTIGISVYTANSNLKQAQGKQVGKIQYEYNKTSDLDSLYNEQAEKYRQNLSIHVYEAPNYENEYSEGDYTNNTPLHVKVKRKNGEDDENAKLTVTDLEGNILKDESGNNVEDFTAETINNKEILVQSCIIKLGDVSFKILVDKEGPDITYNPN